MTEHEAFLKATDSLSEAISAIRVIARNRSDVRDLWLQVAQTLEITKQSLYHLAGDGRIKGKH